MRDAADTSGRRLVHRVAGQGALLTTGFALAQMFSLARNALIGHWLSPADFGIATALTMMLQLIETLTDVGADRLILQAKDGNRPRLMANAHLMYIGRGVLTALVLYIAAGPIAHFFSVDSRQACIRSPGAGAADPRLRSSRLPPRPAPARQPAEHSDGGGTASGGASFHNPDHTLGRKLLGHRMADLCAIGRDYSGLTSRCKAPLRDRGRQGSAVAPTQIRLAHSAQRSAAACRRQRRPHPGRKILRHGGPGRLFGRLHDDHDPGTARHQSRQYLDAAAAGFGARSSPRLPLPLQCLDRSDRPGRGTLSRALRYCRRQDPAAGIRQSLSRSRYACRTADLDVGHPHGVGGSGHGVDRIRRHAAASHHQFDPGICLGAFPGCGVCGLGRQRHCGHGHRGRVGIARLHRVADREGTVRTCDAIPEPSGHSRHSCNYCLCLRNCALIRRRCDDRHRSGSGRHWNVCSAALCSHCPGSRPCCNQCTRDHCSRRPSTVSA